MQQKLERLSSLPLIQQFLRWLKGQYAGVFMMALTILNLLMLPRIIFSVQVGEFSTTKALIMIQTILQVVYLIDLIVMILIFGPKEVLFEKSLSYRFEVVI